jgi:transmembrane protein TMEM260 (protein O-mannosyltransferase)
MPAPLSARRLELLIASAISLSALVVYIVTLCPTTDFIDAGELSTVAYTLGIAHPTGYPLFSIAGWLFAHLPLPVRVVTRLNLMAAIFCAAGLFVYFRFFVHFLSAISLRNPPAAQAHAREGAASLRTILQLYIPAAAGTLCLGFSETYWSQAVAVEVYSLHLLLVAILLLLFTKAIASTDGPPDAEPPRRGGNLAWYGFAFVLGLSFTNHMTTILLAPGFLYLYFATCGAKADSWRRVAKMAPPFLAGFSLYLYMPVRAAQHPLMNWGNPVDLERFLWHFSGKQYRVWIFSSTESAGRQLQYFFQSVLPEFASLPVILAAIGAVHLFARRRRAGVFTLLLFLGCLLYSINYDIHDIDSYFLLAYITIALWAAHGAAYLIGVVKDQRRGKAIALAVVAAALLPLFFNFSSVDESGSSLVENYTTDMFNSVEPGGIILTYEWDYFVSAAYYFQIVEQVRPDVVVIDKELLRRSWYFKQLEQRHPWLLDRSRRELDAYLAELRKFEHDLPYDPKMIEYRYNELIHSMIRRNYASRPVYATAEVEEQYTSGFNRVPSGLAFRLFADTLFHEINPPAYTIRIPARIHKYDQNLITIYARSYFNSALYLNMHGKNVTALARLDSALQLDPALNEARYLREKIAGIGNF